MVNKHIVAVVMNGMNRLSERDTDNVFDIGQFYRIPKEILHETSRIEVTHSTLYYEMLSTVEKLRDVHKLDYSDTQVIMGRGTFGKQPVVHLRDSILKYSDIHGPDAYKIIVAKSFGGIDALRVLMEIQHSSDLLRRIGSINLLILLDTTAPRAWLKAVSEKQNGEYMLRIPHFVKRTCAVIQRVDRFIKGRKAFSSTNQQIDNWEVSADLIDNKTTYAGWINAPARNLTVRHRNMEEILCGPGILTDQGAKGTLDSLATESYKLHIQNGR